METEAGGGQVKEVGSGKKKALTQKEKEFALDYLTKRNAPGTTFGNAEVKEFSQQLKGVEGIERSEGAVYMHLKRLSMPSASKVETEEDRATRNKAFLEKFDHHLQALKRCFEYQLRRRASDGEKKVKKLEAELKKVSEEFRWAQAELRRLTKLRQAIEEIQERERGRK